ncbi:hypothetical protein ABR33_06095 [Enterobacter bugandensis]|uniref:hypothetical protein n=1 Tax=Enterobacter bugandensis TaxID=881260 RepID=UPI000642FAD0|nr:hypothetical protein [Enterobacter bugandensis]KLQ32560.1 hypothetical protein ABR33_06095 [Enterobacter bugandensis]
MTTLDQTLAAIQAEIARQMASGNMSAVVAGLAIHEAAERAMAADDTVIDLEPTEWDLVDDEAQLRALPGYYDGF